MANDTTDEEKAVLGAIELKRIQLEQDVLKTEAAWEEAKLRLSAFRASALALWGPPRAPRALKSNDLSVRRWWRRCCLKGSRELRLFAGLGLWITWLAMISTAYARGARNRAPKRCLLHHLLKT